MTQTIPLGSHELFLAEVAGVMVDEDLLDGDGRLCLDRARLIAYSHGEYRALGRCLGTFGYTVKKRPPRRRGGQEPAGHRRTQARLEENDG